MKSEESIGKGKKIIIIVIVAVIICVVIAGIVIYPRLKSDSTKDKILYNKIVARINSKKYLSRYTANEFPGLDIETIVSKAPNELDIYLNTTSYKDMEKAMISLKNNPYIDSYSIEELFDKDVYNVEHEKAHNIIVVSVSKERSEQNKAYTVDEFPELDNIDKIRLVKVHDIDELYIYVNTNTYDETAKSSEKLEKNPIVKSVHAIGFGSILN